MRIKKRYLFLIYSFFIAFCSLAAMITAVNIIMVKDVNNQAEAQIQSFLSGAGIQDDELVLGEVWVNAIYVEDLKDDSSLKTRGILDYLDHHELKQGVVYHVDTEEGSRIYFALDILNKEVWSGFAAFVGFSRYDNEYMREQIIYVNTDEYLYVLRKLNRIFVYISAVILMIAILAGYRIGASLEHAEGRLKRFFANASHELKTPLTSIQGYAESITYDITPDVKKSARIVMEQGEQMESLVEEMLLLSKIESNAVRLERKLLNAYELLDRLLANSYHRAEQKDIALSCDISGEEAMVKGDERYLYNALSALMSNALKHATSSIHIKAYIRHKKIIISVHDDGAGIDPKDIPHIFERFFTGENHGSGIGLSLAKEIIKLHGGTICAKNENGATFELQLKGTSRNSF